MLKQCLEGTYSRERCKRPLFRIMKFDKSLMKNKIMTAEEFAVNLKVLVGKAGR